MLFLCTTLMELLEYIICVFNLPLHPVSSEMKPRMRRGRGRGARTSWMRPYIVTYPRSPRNGKVWGQREKSRRSLSRNDLSRQGLLIMLLMLIYSGTCLERPPYWHKCGLLKLVVSGDRFNHCIALWGLLPGIYPTRQVVSDSIVVSEDRFHCIGKQVTADYAEITACSLLVLPVIYYNIILYTVRWPFL